MEWINKLNQAITYIEENLESGIDYAEAAKNCMLLNFSFSKNVFIYCGSTSI